MFTKNAPKAAAGLVKDANTKVPMPKWMAGTIRIVVYGTVVALIVGVFLIEKFQLLGGGGGTGASAGAAQSPRGNFRQVGYLKG